MGTGDRWSAGDLYEPYVGRWSRLVAREFLDWIGVVADGDWLDVGCGTGALTSTILERATPRSVTGVDPSKAFIAHATSHVTDERATFHRGDAQDIPFPDKRFDATVSGLVLNFVPFAGKAASEMVRTTKPGGTVAAYVWDYAERMELMRYFWDAALELDPDAPDEGPRFLICNPERLRELFEHAGPSDVEIRDITVPTRFRDFDDYWSPFLGGQGPAPGYAIALEEDHRRALRDLIRSRLPISEDGSIELVARAWAVKAVRPS